jgi:signal transduction histidine kinase
MGALMRSTDWTRNAIGPVADWPQSLRTAISIMLESRFAMVVAWGPEFRFFYNDRYRPVLGTKHPAALGTPGGDIFPEVWSVVGPEFERVRRGEAFAIDDWLLPLDRNGYLENCWFTLSYSPIRDETGGVGGVLAIVAETTGRVEGERRLATLRDLARRAADATTPEHACRNAGEVFDANPIDVPFALIYLLDADGTVARLVSSVGIPVDHAASVGAVAFPSAFAANGGDVWRLAEAIQTGRSLVHTNLNLQPHLGPLPGGPYDEHAHTAILLPLSRPGLQRPYGVMVAGVSPRRALDGRYRDFFELAADHIATGISNAVALEEARRRAEALAEIDRAKTAFFSNVSHEFRTPLTLMLGPAEDLLSGRHDPLTDGQRAQVDILRRNAGRLLKLVNALLDFSRIEAGRAQASYVDTDLAAVTRELAGAFRSAIEHAGLTFDVECDPIGEAVYVDRDMWEKIVLNLLSNAFKFTLAGTVQLRLRQRGPLVELEVRDTGVGIPEAELPRVFERFHRVEGTRSRTYEGSGIGLALTYELVRLHGGSISASSQPGEGSVFTVQIPAGRAHLPADRIGVVPALVSTTIGAAPYVEEAIQWLPPTATRPSADTALHGRERILVVDDNADMRDYLRDLLSGWDVELATDGLRALDAARAHPPDLILTDVMMPGMDGFALLRELRSDPRTGTVPVLMLSARAGEEARISGLAAGADDYVTKPFSARELTARVQSLLAVSKARRETERLRAIAESANRTKDEFLAMLGHELRNPLAPILTALQLMTLRGDGSALKERTVIARQVRHLVRLVDDLLDVSRIARGKVVLRQQRVEMADIVAAAIETTSPLLEERHHQLHVDVPRPGLLVHGDVTRLTQVVVNVLSNAAKYTEPRGHIRVTGTVAGEHVELRVGDTGVGISAEMLPLVFDLFSQERQTLDRAHGGLGLGLTIVRSLVQLHGGTVEARSDGVGRGSEFVLRLPVATHTADVQAPAAAQDTPARSDRHTGHRILVVDDNVDAARLTAEALESVGHETRVAFDGPAALEVAETFAPDLALLDLGLPLMDGYELAQQLVEALPNKRPILVAVTGYGQVSDRERTNAAGFQAHIVKPVDFGELTELLDRLLTEERAG